MPKTGAGHVLHHNYNNSVFYVCESHPMKHMGTLFGTIRRHWYDEKGELELKWSDLSNDLTWVAAGSLLN